MTRGPTTNWVALKLATVLVAVPVLIAYLLMAVPGLWPYWGLGGVVLALVCAAYLPHNTLTQGNLARSPVSIAASGALLILFVVVLAIAAHSEHHRVALALLAGAVLWAGATIAVIAASGGLSINEAAPLTPTAAVSEATLLAGVGFLHTDGTLQSTLIGVILVLLGVTLTLIGVAFRCASGRMLGVAFFPFGAAFLVAGMGLMGASGTLAPLALLPFSVTIVALGMAFAIFGMITGAVGERLLRTESTLLAAGLLLLVVAELLAAAWILRTDGAQHGAVFLLAGAAAVLCGLAALLSLLVTQMARLATARTNATLGAVATWLAGAALLTLGVAAVRAGDTLLGVALLLLGGAGLALKVRFTPHQYRQSSTDHQPQCHS